MRSKNEMKILRKSNKFQDRWREHYSELLNRPTEVNENILDSLQQLPIKDSLVESPSQEEVSKTIKQMNMGKYPGLDGIPAEVLQNGGDNLQEMVFQVIWIFLLHKNGKMQF